MIMNDLLVYNNLLYVINNNLHTLINNIYSFDNTEIKKKIFSLINDLLNEKCKLISLLYQNKNKQKISKVEIERMYKRLKELL